ncbi:putative membrane protein YesL [Arthrobacter pascens]|uniref:hypothetical protein n=1 Tax=Arthrobacter pascens TaxID=1677 RepID=UPI002794F803|nr:hypothetical protein [Arthrobacter pascens]MDQ0680874.1 putative membrane protein YesL [Arthrobacter pascens]
MSTARQHTMQPLRRTWQGPGFETFGSIFGFVYAFLAVNFLLAAANAPLLLGLALVADPVAAWPFFLLLSVTVAPSLAAAFAAFQSLKEAEGPAVRPVAAFLLGYRHSFRRAAPAGLAAVAAVGFLGIDLAIVQVMPAAAVLVPLIAVALTAVVCVAVTVLAGMVLLPQARTRAILKASLYLAVQRWYLSLAALVLLGIIVAAVLVQPVIGVALAPAPLLFVVWSNAAFAFQAALQEA